MKFTLKSAIAGVATLVIAGVGLAALAASASAAPTTPAWEQDANAQAPYGNIVLYDSLGNVLTGGSNLSHLADYAAVTTPDTVGGNKANLIFAAPNHSQSTTALWAAVSASASTSFPSTTAPAPLTGPGFANPVVTLGTNDANLTAALGSFVLDTTPGYANIIQLRVKDTAAGGITSSPHYWSADIVYNNGTAPVTADGVTVAPGNWAQLYPVLTTTATAISANPPSPQTVGANVTLTATVTPTGTATPTGTVQFFDGTTAVGSAQTLTGGTASVVANAPPVGTHSYTAVFTPTGGTPVQGSTSTPLSYVINPPQTGTTTALAGSSTAAQFSSASFTATMTTADSTTQPGSVAFTATGPSPATTMTPLGTVATTTSTAVLNISSVTLAPGAYQVTATFTPTSNSYASSTSPAVAFTVTPSACKGTPVSGASCTDQQSIQVTVNAGSLTITTPYTATNPFVLPAMQLDSSGTFLQSGPVSFPKAGDNPIVVQSSLAGDPNWTVTVSGTDLNTSPANATPIDGKGLGLTNGHLLPAPVFPGTVAFTDNPGHNPGSVPLDTNHGIKGGPWTFAASSGGGNGSAAMYGSLTLYAATSTLAGTYSGTITFAVS